MFICFIEMALGNQGHEDNLEQKNITPALLSETNEYLPVPPSKERTISTSPTSITSYTIPLLFVKIHLFLPNQYVHVFERVCVCSFTCVFIHVCACLFVCVYVCACMCILMCACACVRVYKRGRMFDSACVCITLVSFILIRRCI